MSEETVIMDLMAPETLRENKSIYRDTYVDMGCNAALRMCRNTVLSV